MNGCSAPCCGQYTAELVNTESGSSQEVDLRVLKLSWERVINQPANAALTASEVAEGRAWCCPWENLEPWCWELHIFRDDSRVALYDFHSIFRNPETDSDVLYFTSRMGLVSRRWWWGDYEFSYEATAAFTRVLQEADICDGLGLGYQPIPLGYNTVVKGYNMKPLDRAVQQLTSGTLDYTEYSIGQDLNVVRYGNILYETGETLIEGDWKDQPPSIGINGVSQVSAVVVTNNIQGTSDNSVTGFWPRNSDGTIKKDEHKRWLPLVIEQKDVETEGEAADIARRNFESRRSGKVIQSNGSAKLSESFPVCINDLIPGAVFDVSISSGCIEAEGRYVLESLIVDVDGGHEVSVKADLRERV